MSSVHEVQIALAWLTATLAGDSTLAGLATGGVWRSFAPPGASPVYVIFGQQSGGVDTITMNAYRLLTNPLYRVIAVGPAATEMQTILAAASEIDALLKRATGSATGGIVSACYRESPLLLDELVDGEVWSNVGGLYRLQIQQSS